jgi:hypothetical protein
MRRLAIPLAGLLVLLSATSAQASIRLGQMPPAGASFATCGPSSGSYVQPTVTSGASYVIPGGGRITAWSTVTTANTGQEMRLKIFRPLGGNDYLAVSHDGPHPLTPAASNRFPVDLPVKSGDVLGVNTDGTPNIVGCRFDVPGDQSWTSFPESPQDGESATFTEVSDSRLNLTAEFEPTNAFSLASTTRNKKKGRATITVNVPGPGTVFLSGKGSRPQQASLATPTGGALSVVVVARGKVAKKLRKRGRARVSPTITFTPTGGTPASQSQTLKLVKKKTKKK